MHMYLGKQVFKAKSAKIIVGGRFLCFLEQKPNANANANSVNLIKQRKRPSFIFKNCLIFNFNYLLFYFSLFDSIEHFYLVL